MRRKPPHIFWKSVFDVPWPGHPFINAVITAVVARDLSIMFGWFVVWIRKSPF